MNKKLESCAALGCRPTVLENMDTSGIEPDPSRKLIAKRA